MTPTPCRVLCLLLIYLLHRWSTRFHVTSCKFKLEVVSSNDKFELDYSVETKATRQYIFRTIPSFTV